jgi:hypothetical protein
LPWSGLQQLLQLLLIELGLTGREMTARLVARRYQVQMAVFHALEFAFCDSSFRRIAFIIGGVDRQQRGLDTLQARRWIIVARGLPLVEKVVGISGRRAASRASASAMSARSP